MRNLLIKFLKLGLNLLEDESPLEGVPNQTLTRADVIAILEDETIANDFSHKDLYKIDLSELNLSGCNFLACELTKANCKRSLPPFLAFRKRSHN